MPYRTDRYGNVLPEEDNHICPENHDGRRHAWNERYSGAILLYEVCDSCGMRAFRGERPLPPTPPTFDTVTDADVWLEENA